MPGPKSVQLELNDHLGILQSEKVLKMAESGEIRLETVILLDTENSYKIFWRDPQEVENSDLLSTHLKLAKGQMHNWDVTQTRMETGEFLQMSGENPEEFPDKKSVWTWKKLETIWKIWTSDGCHVRVPMTCLPFTVLPALREHPKVPASRNLLQSTMPVVV